MFSGLPLLLFCNCDSDSDDRPDVFKEAVAGFRNCWQDG